MIAEKKFELMIICLALLVAAMLMMIANAVSASPDNQFVPSLFHNDGPFVYDDLRPLYIAADGVFYIPRDFFNYLDQRHLKMGARDNNFRESFFIQYKDHYISFNVAADRADTVFEEGIFCKVYIIGAATYVPAVLTAQALGLEWEYNEQYNSFRIREAGARLTFDELLAPYIARIPTTPAPTPAPTTTARRPVTTRPPAVTSTTQPPVIGQPQTQPAGEEPTATTNNPVVPPQTPTEPIPPATPPPRQPAVPEQTTEPEITTEPTTPENTREIENHLIFYNITNDIEQSGILEMLEENNMRAMFFMSGGEIAEYPDVLRKIYASGHSPGIRLESGEAISELEAVNDLIYSVIKHKTRFYMSAEDPEIREQIREQETELRQKGYYLCVETADILNLRGISGADEMIEFMKRRRINIFAFDLNGEDGNKDFLGLSVRAAREKFYINFSHINNANIENINRQINR